MKQKARDIDLDYFLNYGGPGNRYKDCWYLYSYADRCVDTQRKLKLKISKIVILGMASGEVAQHFLKRDKYDIYGCENFTPAYLDIPDFLKTDSKILLADMRDYVKIMPDVDLVFSNGLVYLEEYDVLPLLCHIRTNTKYMYFSAPQPTEPDKYRRINRSRAWWDRRFKMCGFKKIGPNMWESRWKPIWTLKEGWLNGKKGKTKKAKKKTVQRHRKKRQSR